MGAYPFLKSIREGARKPPRTTCRQCSASANCPPYCQVDSSGPPPPDSVNPEVVQLRGRPEKTTLGESVPKPPRRFCLLAASNRSTGSASGPPVASQTNHASSRCRGSPYKQPCSGRSCEGGTGYPGCRQRRTEGSWFPAAGTDRAAR